MSYPERQTITEVGYVGMWCSPVFWGLVLVVTGVVALLPDDFSRYGWPVVAIAAGLWLLFGPLYWSRERPLSRYAEPADRF